MLDATPLFRLYARHRLRTLARQDAVDIQRRELLRLLETAKGTAFGRDHGFTDLRTVEAFQNRVPLRRYEEFWESYWRASFPRLVDCCWPGTIPYFAETSGTTTGATKHIPVTHAMNRANMRAAADLLVHHLVNRPQSRLFAGRSFMLGGSTALRELAPDIWSGDLSGIAAKAMPWWARLRYYPPRKLETIADWEEKIAALAPRAIEQDIRSISGMPSWLLIFFDRLGALRPEWGRRLAGIWPELELLVHGGVQFVPYRPVFRELLAGSQAETREVYVASEGFIAVADRGDGEGLRLLVDTGLFFEFVPVDELASSRPTRHWLADVDLDVNYAVVLSSCAGVWAYVLGDTVRFVDRAPPRILVTGRTSYTLSAFGEHLIDEEIEKAVAEAAAAIGRRVVDYSVGAVYPETERDLGGHLYIVEFDAEVPDATALDAFARLVDDALAAGNDDYRVHRARGFALRAPRVDAVPPGTFAAWMKRRGQLGGQHKVPRIINDEELLRDLRTFVEAP